MNGMFPGHVSPDPGIVEGWMSNIVNYLQQIAGDNFEDIDIAITEFNKRDAGIATDPDIDRAGMMIGLPDGVKGNIKDALIEYII
jgi:hypothetical protein